MVVVVAVALQLRLVHLRLALHLGMAQECLAMPVMLGFQVLWR